MKSAVVLNFLLIVSSLAQGADLCALRVEVVNGLSGVPATAGLLGRLVREGIAFETRQTDKNGRMYFCDVDFTKFDLEIGQPGTCGFTVISGLSVDFPMERRLKVFETICGGDVLQTGCLLYLRIADTNGSPISGAAVGPEVSDSYGRVLVGARLGETKEYSVVKSGFATETGTLECKVIDYRKKYLILRRSQ